MKLVLIVDIFTWFTDRRKIAGHYSHETHLFG